MTEYFRPLAQLGRARPNDAITIAGTQSWFTHVEHLSRNGASLILAASDTPSKWRKAVHAKRSSIAGLNMAKPIIMGILNVTPDSFSDGGQHHAPAHALSAAKTMVEEGAHLLDIGGESTRPGAMEVPYEAEIARTMPVIKAIRQSLDTPISIDTRKARVADAALDAGADIVNDVSGFQFDRDLGPFCAAKAAPVCLMHAQGLPETMQNAPSYRDVLLDVYDFLEQQINFATSLGVKRDQIIVDPGLGFGKTQAHNLALIQGISLFHGLGCAILLGASRKGFIRDIGNAPQASDRAPGSIAVALAAVQQGVQIVRVHDVSQTRQALALFSGRDDRSRIMTRKLFGTDGVRGTANDYPMTAEMALRIGAAAGVYFRRNKANVHRVVIGKDTRRSGYMLESALSAGLTSTGMSVFLMGPIPTPAVGMLTPSMRADVGIMISASHNPHQDNGIKFFGPDGFKLSDEAEMEIEALVESGVDLVEPMKIGRTRHVYDGRSRYNERVKAAFPNNLSLDGMKVVIDCANGAAYRAAPEVLWELGAEVIPVGVAPNGYNINENCGSTKPMTASEAVIAHGADVGICLDGDADRCIILDEKGKVADGDQFMGLIAGRWAEENRLRGGTLVATVMSNLGLERHLQGKGLTLTRTGVGDRYVVEEMRKNGFNLGGEQSGHIVMTDYATTGDGLMAGLQFLGELARTGRKASELIAVFEPVPQMLKNVRYTAGQVPLENGSVQSVISGAEKALIGKGRLLIRKSGTEPLIRVMAECEDPDLLNDVVDRIVDEVARATAA